MSEKNIFVKVSGDLFFQPDFLKWLAEITENNKVVVCIGGGGQINDAFAKKGWPIKKHGPLGREAENYEQKKVAKNVLKNNQRIFKRLIEKAGINAKVIIPVLHLNGVMCHVNGDVFIKTFYLGFDELYVVTTEERVEAKKKDFDNLPKIQVVGFEAGKIK
jgi:hypothetical protein